MLIKDVPAADRNQLFGDGIIYSKSYGWCVIKAVDGTYVDVRIIKSGVVDALRFDDVEFNLNKAPNLGFVNTQYGAGYVARLPKRLMHALPCIHNIATNGVSSSSVMRSKIREHLLSIPKTCYDGFNKNYPTLEAAIQTVKELKISVAFDTQFAIDETFLVHYCSHRPGGVGKVVDGKIVFLPEFKNLEILIGDGYVKAIQGVKKAAAQRVARN